MYKKVIEGSLELSNDLLNYFSYVNEQDVHNSRIELDYKKILNKKSMDFDDIVALYYLLYL